MFSIGEFSKITGLTVKTLRFYHEKGILAPACVDQETGYRYYDARQVDTARIISQLRGLDFPLDQIGAILHDFNDEADILDQLERHKEVIEGKLRQHRTVARVLDQIIKTEKEARKTMQTATYEVLEKTLEPLLIAGIRMKGRYQECGKGFAKIGKVMWRRISGKCFLLHYDTEYKENEADFETCMPIGKAKDEAFEAHVKAVAAEMPVKSAKAVDGIAVRELPGGRCVRLMHKGPYEELSRSYAKIMAYIKEKKYETILPTREVYVKGPGMIFKGNPKKYLTEIQILVK